MKTNLLMTSIVFTVTLLSLTIAAMDTIGPSLLFTHKDISLEVDSPEETLLQQRPFRLKHKARIVLSGLFRDKSTPYPEDPCCIGKINTSADPATLVRHLQHCLPQCSVIPRSGGMTQLVSFIHVRWAPHEDAKAAKIPYTLFFCQIFQPESPQHVWHLPEESPLGLSAELLARRLDETDREAYTWLPAFAQLIGDNYNVLFDCEEA